MKPMEVEVGGSEGGLTNGRERGTPKALVKKQSSHMDVNTPGGLIWLLVCFFGIMTSFIAYGIVMEYATSGGRRLHELSLIFVTSLLYSGTAYVGRHVRGERPTEVAPSKLMLLAVTSMGSTYCSVRSLRYVIYPVQVLAKSCKPIPVMIMGAFLGKKYPLKKYFNVAIITAGVAMFMMGKPKSGKGEKSTTWAGVILLFISLCFDGGTGAYEDKLMAKHHVGPFDLMYNMHLGKAILAGIGLIVMGQINYFIKMCHETGFLLLLLGVSGAFGQVFIFVTISKFGALTCSIMGLARKVVTLVASIYIYGHSLNGVQTLGLVVAFAAMIGGFFEKKGPKHHGGHGERGSETPDAGKAFMEQQRRTDSQAESKPLLSQEEEPDEEAPPSAAASDPSTLSVMGHSEGEAESR
jgi:solute carrier family 35 (UDP-galactose transporter), member B1